MLETEHKPPRPRGFRESHEPRTRFGAFAREGGVTFRIFADAATDARVRFYEVVPSSGMLGEPAATHPMVARGAGVWELFVAGAAPGTRYDFTVDGAPHADPWARSLPDGVHSAAAVAAPLPPLEHPRRPIDLAAGEVLYELHVGTFTKEGTFAAAAERLAELRDLGVTVVELMPVAAFPGRWNWGYDGVAPYAPFAGYGRLEDLRRFLEHAHGLGLGVLLDVVYNHVGPDGCHLAGFSSSFFRAASSAWGSSPKVDEGPFAELVLDNARYWLEDVGFDGLRLDATHALEPGGEPHILERLAGLCRSLPGRPVLIAEDERNDPALVKDHGLDGVWADDLHHVLHVLLTGEHDGYYAGYPRDVDVLAKTVAQGWLYEGQPWPPTGMPRGKPLGDLAPWHLVTSLQNHDQVGNRAQGERLSALVSEEAYAAAALLFLLAPTTPLLFMGEEWAASSPFQYFTDHHGELGRQVEEGRRREFGSFGSFGSDAVPSPQAPETFERSKLLWEERAMGRHRRTLELYRRALHLRHTDPVLASTRRRATARALGSTLELTFETKTSLRQLLINFSADTVPLGNLLPTGATFEALVASPQAAAALEAGAAHLPPHGAALLAVRRSAP